MSGPNDPSRAHARHLAEVADALLSLHEAFRKLAAFELRRVHAAEAERDKERTAR